MTRRLLAAFSAAVLTAAFLCLPQAAAGQADPTRGDLWQAIAQRALTRLQTLDTGGTQAATTLAYAAQATAWLSPTGWADPAATAYLTRLYTTQNPDGGYGLGYAYDAHGDGTCAPPTPTSCNPATTTYTVTLAGYVGPVLLDAYRHGVAAVPRAKVQQLFDLLATTPRIDTAAGRCVAYSRNANDVKTGLCVHNVNSGTGAFLLEAGVDGFAVPWWLVQGIAKRELSAYNQTTRFWPYKDATSTVAQDADHNSYSTEGMYGLAYPVAYSAAYVALTATPDGDPDTPLVYVRLVGLPAAPTAMSGGTTIWCLLGDTWLDEVDAFVTAGWSNIGRMAQVAYYAARAARACGPLSLPPTTAPATTSPVPSPSPSISAVPTTPVTTPTPTETVSG